MTNDNMDLEKGGVKYDADKTRYDLVPWDSLDAAADVFTYGANKYRDRNWEVGMRHGRFFAACLRHLKAYWQDGEDKDPESGKLHLAHALCCLHMLTSSKMRGIGEDDRPVKPREELRFGPNITPSLPAVDLDELKLPPCPGPTLTPEDFKEKYHKEEE